MDAIDGKYLLFLLGGYDLEMRAIRDVLEAHHIRYVDRRLQWDNACLSQYEEELRSYCGERSPWKVYGIELREDVPPPVNYTRIDHHNQYAGQPSALEQVMALLRLPLDRHLSLVAANDKAYIPGMQALGASAEEIAQIRLADRKAQGVTPNDECLAEIAIEKDRVDVGDLIVIRAQSPRFSPICDRLYPYRRLLVYTSEEWMYYGEGVVRLREYFATDLVSGLLFYGGGDHGYMGSEQGVYTPGQILRMVEQIKQYTL